jgi:tRNA-Thr(GGU) m(6)t(6)A37 methyltransferase TsaA
MAKEGKTLKMDAIGYVRNEFTKEVPKGYENLTSKIEINKELSEGLHKIEENSHITVIFFMDRVKDEERRKMRMHPKGREDLPLLGVFATRSPRRPNPIGIRAVRLLARRDNILSVEGLDALNGTPVLDIKPYSPKHDLVEDAKTPWWAKNLSSKKY